MIKKILIPLFCVLFALPFVLCADAQTEVDNENAEHYYDEYDDYYQMEQDYIDSEVVDKTPQKESVIFIPAIILGAAAGLGVTYIVLNSVFAPPKPDPYFRKAEEKHKTVNQADEKIG
ncbi:MAG: hypothetical protein IJN81_10725 [Clostridia bacterium]|nr:hypothetical protein [Clostridia bacterium]